MPPNTKTMSDKGLKDISYGKPIKG
jgi:hypothetical protein